MSKPNMKDFEATDRPNNRFRGLTWQISLSYVYGTSPLLKKDFCSAIHRTMITRTFFSLEIYCPTKAHNVTQILHLHSSQISHGKYSSLCIIVLGTKTHETAASHNYALLGYSPTCFVELLSVKITHATAKNYTRICLEI